MENVFRSGEAIVMVVWVGGGGGRGGEVDGEVWV